MILDDFLARLDGVKRSGKGWSARCPGHDDQRASLAVSEGDDGRVLIDCKAGCAPAAVVAKMGLSLADLFAEGGNGHRPASAKTSKPAQTFGTAKEAVAALERQHGKRSADWTYRDAQGQPVGLVLRWDGPGGKNIRPVSRDGDGWRIGGMPTPRPLYRLPELLVRLDEPVYVCEGEKAADAAVAVGLLATTSAHGAKAAASADWSALAGRDVVVLPDNDTAGDSYANDVAAILAKLDPPATVRIVHLRDGWPDQPKGGDLADVAGDPAAIKAAIERLNKAAVPVRELPSAKPTAGKAIRTANLVRLSDVLPQPVTWLWPGRVAIGKLTLIAGDPGLGKSFVTLDMASRVSTGAGWPDAPRERFDTGGVVLLTAEDDPADTIRPRLDAAGADPTRVVALQSVTATDPDSGNSVHMGLNLARDLDIIEDAIGQVDRCRLVVVDPITAYLGGVDSHKNAEVRGLLAPLSALAARLGVAVVAVTHLNKNAAGPAIYRTMGSLAFAAAARAVWGVVKDKDDPARRLMLPIKNNLAPDGSGLAFKLWAERPDNTPVVAWEAQSVTMSADEAMGEPAGRSGPEPAERTEAADWLRDQLADGPAAVVDLKDEAGKAGFAWRTVQRAKDAIGARSIKAGMDAGWAWALPVDASPPEEHDEGCQPVPVSNNLATFGEPGILRDSGPPKGFIEGPKIHRNGDFGPPAEGSQVTGDGSVPGYLRPADRAAAIIDDVRQTDPGRASDLEDAWAERLAVCTADGMSEADAERVALAELAGMATGGHNALDTGRNIETIIP